MTIEHQYQVLYREPYNSSSFDGQWTDWFTWKSNLTPAQSNVEVIKLVEAHPRFQVKVQRRTITASPWMDERTVD